MKFSLRCFILVLVLAICAIYAILLGSLLVVQITSIEDISKTLMTSVHSHTMSLLERQMAVPKFVAKLMAVDYVAHKYQYQSPPYINMVLPLIPYTKVFPDISIIAFVGSTGFISELRKDRPDGPADIIEVSHPPDYYREYHQLTVDNSNNRSAPFFTSSLIKVTDIKGYGLNASWWDPSMPDEGAWLLYAWKDVQINLSFGSKIMHNGTLHGFCYVDYTLDRLNHLLRDIEATDGVRIMLISEKGELVASNANITSASGKVVVQKATEVNDPTISDAARFLNKKAASGSPVRPGTQYALSANGQSYILSTSVMVLDTAKGQNWTTCLLFPRSAFFAASDSGLIYSIVAVIIVFLASLGISIILVSAVSKHIQRIVSQVDGVVSYRDNAFSTTPRGDSPRLFRVTEVQALQDSVTRMKTILQSFEKYIPVQLLKYLVSQNKPAELGLERATASVMFLDVAGFTSIMESRPLNELIEQFTEYCNEAINVIVQNHGTLDKMMGDGMMAFFGCPPTVLRDHQYWAARCALHLQRLMVHLRVKWVKEGKVPLHIRIGIASGPVSVGNVGSSRRFQYTVLGDVVNLAARMESLNKRFGTATLLTGHAYTPLEEGHIHVIARRLGTVKVKGRTARTRIYELITAAEMFEWACEEETRPLTAGQCTALSLHSDLMDEAPSERAWGMSERSIGGSSMGAGASTRTELSEWVLQSAKAQQLPRDPLFEFDFPEAIRQLPLPVYHLAQYAAVFSRAISKYESRQFMDAVRLLEFYQSINHSALRQGVRRLEQDCYLNGTGTGTGTGMDHETLEESIRGRTLEQDEVGREYVKEVLEKSMASLRLSEPELRDFDPVVTMTEK